MLSAGRNKYGSLELGEAASVEEGVSLLGQECTASAETTTTSSTAYKAAAVFLLGTAAIAAVATQSNGLTPSSAAFSSSPSKHNAQAFYDKAMSDLPKSRLHDTSSSDASSYFVYKHTIPISNGTASTISTALSTYISPVLSTVNLGCTTYKVVGTLAAPSLTLPSGSTVNLGGEIHFVDTQVFDVAGASVESWVSVMEGLGMDSFNAFMHNKAQLYVPDLSPALAKLHTDGVDMVLRLSSSEGTDDVAHVGIQLAGRMYELVGPASSITSGDYSSTTADLISLFSAWSDDECPEAHELSQHNLTALSTYYKAAYKTLGAQDWETSTGLYTPMLVGMTAASSALSGVSSVLSALETVAGASTSTASLYSGACEVATITFDSSDMFQPFAKYVANTGATQGAGAFTVAQWEADVADSHVTYTLDAADDDGNSMSGWDHYLDQHIGLMRYFYTADSDACYLENAEVLAQVQGLPVGGRSDTGDSAAAANATHYYTGYPGLITWEYNVYNCAASSTTTYDELCGCSEENSAQKYYVETDGVSYCDFDRR